MAEFIGREFDHDAWRQRYDADMRHAADLYADVIEAVRQLEVPAEVTQTGGMCLAVTWPARGGYWLLTDIDGPLPWSRDEVTGWALGRYDEDDQLVGDVLDTDATDPAGAVELILRTVR